MKKSFRLTVFIFFLLGIWGCTRKIQFDVLRPARYDISDLNRIAVVDFDGPGSAGKSVATRFSDRLWKTGYFSIMERSKLQQVLEEHSLNMSGVVDDSSAVAFGKILGVEALVFGNVFSYVCEDIRGTEKVMQQVWTGDYVRDKNGKIVYEKTLFGKRKKKKYKEELVDRPFIQRDATVGISFRVVDIETGEIRASDSKSRTFNQKYVNNFNRIPSKEAILNKLSDDILYRFIPLVAPHRVRITKQFETGNDAVKLGIELAENNLWDKAKEIWENEAKNNPDNTAAIYNLGIAYEVLQQFDRAESAYERALDIEPKEMYMNALSSIRKRKKDQQKLDLQLKEKSL